MIFIGVALAVAIGLALIISADAGSALGLDQSETARLVALVAILIVIAGGAFGRRRQLGEMLANLVLWGALFGVAIVGYTYRTELSQIGRRVVAQLTPGDAVVDAQAGTATFQRSLTGSFQVNVEVNGAQMKMIFDTGASAVVLTRADAQSAGIDVDNLRFTLPVQTANGTGLAAQTRLARIEVGGIARTNVSALVAQEDALETSLLGMTYLSTLSGFSVANDALILTD